MMNMSVPRRSLHIRGIHSKISQEVGNKRVAVRPEKFVIVASGRLRPVRARRRNPERAHRVEGTLQAKWRRERDSNPRYPFGYSGFQDRLFQPLTHHSATALTDILAAQGCNKDRG